MLHFIIVRANSEKSLSDVLSNIRSVALKLVPAWPNFIHLKLFKEQNAAVLAFENTGSAGFEKRYITEVDETVFAFDGLPYFDGLDPANYVSSFRKHHMTYGNDEEAFQAKTYGAWAKAWVSRGGAYVLGDFCGLAPLYTLETDNFVAVSNRQLLLGAARDGAQINLSRLNSAWLLGQASHMGSDMMVRGVKQVMPASAVRISFTSDKPRLSFQEHSLATPKSELRDDLSKLDADALTESLVAQMDTFDLLPIDKIQLDITGGMDSRCIVAMASASRLKDKIGTLHTHGREESREIAIGRELAQRFGLPHKAAIAPPSSMTFDRILRQVKSQVLRYEGMICPTDGFSASSEGSGIIVSGSVGEIFRRHCKPHMKLDLQTPLDVYNTYSSYQQPTDPLAIQKPDITVSQIDMMRSEALRLVSEGIDPNDVSDLYFMNYRVPHWNGVIQNNIRRSVRVTPFANYIGAKVSFAHSYKLRLADRYHFEVLSRLNPDLAAFPFLDNTWSPHVRAIADARGMNVASEPFATSEPKTMRDIAQIGMHVCVDYKDQARDYILGSWSDGLDGLVERAAVEHWLSAGEPNKKGITGVKEIMSLLNLTSLFSGDFIAAWEGDTRIPAKLDANAESLFGVPEISVAAEKEKPLSFRLV